MTAFSAEGAFPPSLASMPFLAMLTVMSFWIVVLICLQWLYEIVDSARDLPAPPESYIATSRRFRFWIVFSILIVAAPRLVQLMVWHSLSPDGRELVSVIAWVVRIPSAVMVAFAWWKDKRMRSTEAAAVLDHGFFAITPVALREKTTSIIVLVLIFVVAFSTTFVRASTHVDTDPIRIERHD